MNNGKIFAMQTLPKRLSHCVLKGEPFEHGQEYVSFLDPEGNRKDYCPQCWEKIDKERNGHFWRGQIPLKKVKERHRDERALELFRQLQEPKKRFALALYLQRKHQLIRRTQTLYEIPESGELFNVEIVLISKEEGEMLAKEIDGLLA
jgi:hypothetical protein